MTVSRSRRPGAPASSFVRRVRPGRGVALLGVVALCLSASGCFLQTISGATFEAGGSLITTVETNSVLAACTNLNFTVECTYFFRDENGVPVDVISSADLISEFGLLGVLIDPLIYQIPLGATNIIGTYDDGAGVGGDLVIRSGFKSIPVDTKRTLFAEHRQQFVIAELPPGVPFDGVEFDFTLSFDMPANTPTPIAVKSLLSIKFTGGGQEFYTPMVPCAQSMADVAPLEVPLASSLQPLDISASATGCSGEVYELLGFGVFPCDFDADDDVDADDIALLSSVRNAPALPGDRLDATGDGWIDLNDARACARQCQLPRCAIVAPPDMGVILPNTGLKR